LVCDEIRDFGEGIIASDQEPTKLSNSLKANTYTKITGFLGNGKDICRYENAPEAELCLKCRRPLNLETALKAEKGRGITKNDNSGND